MDVAASVALAAGAAWASGINVYAVILVLGILGSTGYMTLPPDLEILMNPLVLAAAGFMYFVEFVADKTPGVDTGWDAIHTFVRVPAGATMAAAALGDMDPAVQIAAFIVGGGLAAGSHATKAGSRVIINASPEPVSNWVASFTEDFVVIGSLWTALNYPVVFLASLFLVVLLMIWLLPKIWQAIKTLGMTLRDFFRRGQPPQKASDAAVKSLDHP